MRFDTYYEVSYQNRVRFGTVSRDEAENYARALFARDSEVGSPPTIDEIDRRNRN
jgi:hypothetical protein